MAPSKAVLPLFIAVAVASSVGCVPKQSAYSSNTRNEVVAAPPASEKELVHAVQRMLREQGFNPGPIDGVPGPKTRSALKEFQIAKGLPESDAIDQVAYQQLMRAEKGVTSSKKVRRSETGTRKDEKHGNHKSVEFRVECSGLTIPRVRQEKFRGYVPAFSIVVKNTTNNRYTVKYDMTYTQQGRGGYAGVAKETLTDHKSLVSTPSSTLRFWVKEVSQGNHVVRSVDKISVYSCVAE